MAKKDKVIKDPPQEDLPNLTTETIPVTAEERREEHEYLIDNVDRAKLDQIIMSADLQKGGKIRLERKGPLDRDFQYVTTMPAEGWDTERTLEWIKSMFGGGDYRCQTFRANGQMYKPFAFSIDYRMKGKLDEQEIKQMGGSPKDGNIAALKILEGIRPSPDSIFKSSDMLKMVEMSQGRNDQMMTLIMTMMVKSQETMSTVMGNVMAAIVSSTASRNGQSSLDPVVIELIKAKQDRPPMMEVLEMMKMIKELNEEPPKEEKEETMFDKILKVAGVVMPALQQGQQPVGALPPGTPPQPQGPQFPPAFRFGLGMLKKAAERNADPVLYADMIIDQVLTPEQLVMLKTLLTDSSWKVKLFGDEQSVAHINGWLEQVRQLILEYDPNAPQPEDNGTAGTSDQGAPVVVGTGPNPDTEVP